MGLVLTKPVDVPNVCERDHCGGKVELRREQEGDEYVCNLCGHLYLPTSERRNWVDKHPEVILHCLVWLGQKITLIRYPVQNSDLKTLKGLHPDLYRKLHREYKRELARDRETLEKMRAEKTEIKHKIETQHKIINGETVELADLQKQSPSDNGSALSLIVLMDKMQIFEPQVQLKLIDVYMDEKKSS
tara:strand:- start:110 stop:673 length:564 start_codon:yes stop_codon:yes gene_type:complete